MNTFETILKSAATQFVSAVQHQLVEHLWSQFAETPLTKEKLEQSLSDFFNQKVEKVVEEKPKTVAKKSKSTNSCEVLLATGEKKGQPCGSNADEQIDGQWMCGKHKKKAPKKPVGEMAGFVGEPVDTKKKKIAGELPNEQIPLNLKELQGSVEETLLKQVDNLENLLNENKPVVEEKPKKATPKKSEEKVQPKVEVKNVEPDTKPEAKKTKPKKKSEEKAEQPKVEVKEDKVEETKPLMVVPPIEELEKQEEKPKKVVIKRRKKVEAPKPIKDAAMDALEAADV